MDTNSAKNPGPLLSKYLEKRIEWKTVGLWLVGGLCLLIAIVWFGRDSAHEIKTMETWIEGHGVWGLVVGSVASGMTKVAGNVSDDSVLHTVITIVGFVVCVVLMISITRVATKALADAELESTPAKDQSDTNQSDQV